LHGLNEDIEKSGLWKLSYPCGVNLKLDLQVSKM